MHVVPWEATGLGLQGNFVEKFNATIDDWRMSLARYKILGVRLVLLYMCRWLVVIRLDPRLSQHTTGVD